MENIFYVYIYLDPRKPGTFTYGDFSFPYEPFYVGMGKNQRMFHHLSKSNLISGENTIKTRKIKKIIDAGFDLRKDYILKIKENLSQLDAKQLEIATIKLIGRFSLKTGPLSNLTDGGDGSVNFKHKASTKALLSKIHTGIKYGPETRSRVTAANIKRWQNLQNKEQYVKDHYVGSNNPNYGNTGSKSKLFGRTYSTTHVENLSKSKQGALNPNVKPCVVITPQQEKIEWDGGISDFVLNHPTLNISKGKLYYLAKHQVVSPDGWQCFYIT